MTTIGHIKKSVVKMYSKHFTGHIALYHSCFQENPSIIDYKIHNIKPEVLYKQLYWYKQNFDIVSVEDWFSNSYRGGSVAITFDDAYLSVFQNALPILKELNIPATIFIIGSTLEGRIFWRDKIRYIVANSLTNEFLKYIETNFNTLLPFNEENFYKKSKSVPVLKKLSNENLDEYLTSFLQEKGVANHLLCFCANKVDDLPQHPLITYGSHSYNHYLLSSLSDAELRYDLKKSTKIIKSLKNRRTTSVLSVPFGRLNSINRNIFRIVNKLNYSAILLSDNRINGAFNLDEIDGTPIGFRYMVPDSLEKLQDKVRTMAYHKLMNKNKYKNQDLDNFE